MAHRYPIAGIAAAYSAAVLAGAVAVEEPAVAAGSAALLVVAGPNRLEIAAIADRLASH